MTIEVSLGYYNMETWRALHERVEALGAGVAGVVYRSDPPNWLLSAAKVAVQTQGAVVLNIRGVAPEQAVALVPFDVYERLLGVSRETDGAPGGGG
jgi:hypothetical protein